MRRLRIRSGAAGRRALCFKPGGCRRCEGVIRSSLRSNRDLGRLTWSSTWRPSITRSFDDPTRRNGIGTRSIPTRHVVRSPRRCSPCADRAAGTINFCGLGRERAATLQRVCRVLRRQVRREGVDRGASRSSLRLIRSECDRPRPDSWRRRNDDRRIRISGARHPARPLGRPRRNREGRPRAHRFRFHYGRDDPCRRWTTCVLTLDSRRSCHSRR